MKNKKSSVKAYKRLPGGRTGESGPKSSINLQLEDSAEVPTRLLRGVRRQYWLIFRLRSLLARLAKNEKESMKAMLRKEIKDARDEETREKLKAALAEVKDRTWKLAGNYLSAVTAFYRAAAGTRPETRRKSRRKTKTAADAKATNPADAISRKIGSLWTRLLAEFEAAVLDHDAERAAKWLEGLAAAIRWSDKHARLADDRNKSTKQRARFDSFVFRLLRQRAISALCGSLLKNGGTSAAPTNDERMTTREIFQTIKKRGHVVELPNGHVVVLGCRFENTDRVQQAICELADQMPGGLRKQPRASRAKRRT